MTFFNIAFVVQTFSSSAFGKVWLQRTDSSHFPQLRKKLNHDCSRNVSWNAITTVYQIPVIPEIKKYGGNQFHLLHHTIVVVGRHLVELCHWWNWFPAVSCHPILGGIETDLLWLSWCLTESLRRVVNQFSFLLINHKVLYGCTVVQQDQCSTITLYYCITRLLVYPSTIHGHCIVLLGSSNISILHCTTLKVYTGVYCKAYLQRCCDGLYSSRYMRTNSEKACCQALYWCPRWKGWELKPSPQIKCPTAADKTRECSCCCNHRIQQQQREFKERKERQASRAGLEEGWEEESIRVRRGSSSIGSDGKCSCCCNHRNQQQQRECKERKERQASRAGLEAHRLEVMANLAPLIAKFETGERPVSSPPALPVKMLKEILKHYLIAKVTEREQLWRRWPWSMRSQSVLWCVSRTTRRVASI